MPDCKKIYEDYFNIKVDDEFVIHHLDGNRNNNDIKNLLMLPSELHGKYHEAQNEFETVYCSLNTNLTLASIMGVDLAFAKLAVLKNMIDKCHQWVNYKVHLELKKSQESK